MKKDKDSSPATTSSFDAQEAAETVRMAVTLAEEDQREIKSWKVGTDTAAFSRQRIVRPDQSY